MNRQTNTEVPSTPSPQPDPAANKPMDMSGVISAIIPLAVTALIFMIGWAYQLIWYSFFGVSPTQISVSVPLILAQSLPTVSIAVTIILLGFFVYISLSLIFNTVDFLIPLLLNWLKYLFGDIWMRLVSLWARVRHRPPPIPNNYIFTNLTTQVFIAKIEWGIILSSILLITFLVSMGNPYRIVFGLITAVPVIFIFVVILIISGTIVSILRISKPFSEYARAKRTQVVILSILYYFLIIIMSASMAFSDAVVGKRGILLETVQDVFLVGPKILGFVPELEIFCDSQENTCIYGPFGLVAENDDSYFLVEWDTSSQNQTPEFAQGSGLYVIPRSGQAGAYVLMPEIALPSPTPTLLPSVTPTPQITVTPAFTPQLTMTITPTVTPP
jgi:hypothetical protein